MMSTICAYKNSSRQFVLWFLLLLMSSGLYLTSLNVIAQQTVVRQKNPILAESIVLRPLSRLQLANKHFYQGVVLARRGANDEAIKQFSISLRYDDADPSTVLALAKLYFSNSDYKVAISRLHASLKLNPGHYAIITQLAYNYTELQQYRDVINMLSNRAGSEGADVKASSLLAYAYIQTNEFNKAIRIYRNLSLIHPDGVAWRLGKAIGLEGDGKIAKALLTYVKLKSQYSLNSDLTQFVNSKIVSLHERRQSN